MKFNKGLFFALTFAFLLAALPVSAALPTLVPPCAREATLGAPPLSCFLELGVNITNWILGITGSLALLFFIYGGFLFLTSRGAEQQITKGKTILTQAAIGIIIIFGAYIGIKFIVSALGAGKFFKTEFETTQPIEPKIPAPPAPTATTPPPTGSVSCQCTTAVKTISDPTPGKMTQKQLLQSAEAMIKTVCVNLKGTTTLSAQKDDTALFQCLFTANSAVTCTNAGKILQDAYNKQSFASGFGVSCSLKQ